MRAPNYFADVVYRLCDACMTITILSARTADRPEFPKFVLRATQPPERPFHICLIPIFLPTHPILTRVLSPFQTRRPSLHRVSVAVTPRPSGPLHPCGAILLAGALSAACLRRSDRSRPPSTDPPVRPASPLHPAAAVVRLVLMVAAVGLV